MHSLRFFLYRLYLAIVLFVTLPHLLVYTLTHLVAIVTRYMLPHFGVTVYELNVNTPSGESYEVYVTTPQGDSYEIYVNTPSG